MYPITVKVSSALFRSFPFPDDRNKLCLEDCSRFYCDALNLPAGSQNSYCGWIEYESGHKTGIATDHKNLDMSTIFLYLA